MSLFKSLAFIYLTTFIVFLCWSVQRPYVPLFATSEVGATLVEAGIIASAGGLTGAIFSTPMGSLSDRYGRKIFIILGAIVLGISFVLIAGSSSSSQVLLAFAVSGLAASMVDTSLSAIIADLVSPSRLGRAYGLFSTALQSSFSIGPAAGGFLIFLLGFRSTFLAGGMLVFVGAFLATLIPKPVKYRSDRRSFQILARSSLKDSYLRLGLLLTITTSLVIGGSIAYLPLYLREVGYDIITIGLLFTGQSISAALSRLPLGILVDRLRAEKATALVAVLTTSAIISVLPFVQDLLGIAALLVLLGPSVGAVGLVGTVIVAKYAQPASRGLMMGFNSTFRFLGFFLGPFIVASVITFSGVGLEAYRYGFITLGLMAAIVVSVALATVKRAE